MGKRASERTNEGWRERFCREHKNRKLFLQTSNARSLTTGRFVPFYHGTRQQPRSPLPRVQGAASYGAFSAYYRPVRFVGRPKIDTLFDKLQTAVSSLVGATRPCSWQITPATPAPPPCTKHSTVRPHFRVEIMVFCKDAKNLTHSSVQRRA